MTYMDCRLFLAEAAGTKSNHFLIVCIVWPGAIGPREPDLMICNWKRSLKSWVQICRATCTCHGCPEQGMQSPAVRLMLLCVSCNVHYTNKWLKTVVIRAVCVLPGCQSFAVIRGYCRKHGGSGCDCLCPRCGKTHHSPKFEVCKKCRGEQFDFLMKLDQIQVN